MTFLSFGMIIEYAKNNTSWHLFSCYWKSLPVREYGDIKEFWNQLWSQSPFDNRLFNQKTNPEMSEPGYPSQTIKWETACRGFPCSMTWKEYSWPCSTPKSPTCQYPIFTTCAKALHINELFSLFFKLILVCLWNSFIMRLLYKDCYWLSMYYH